MMYPEPGSKRHAVRNDDPDSPLYWVGNDADWREVQMDDRAWAKIRTDHRARAAIRDRAAADLAQRIHRIEARIEALEEHKAKLAADAQRLGSAAIGHLTRGSDLELGKLTGQLAILRRQEAILTECPAPATPATSALPRLCQSPPRCHRLMHRLCPLNGHSGDG